MLLAAFLLLVAPAGPPPTPLAIVDVRLHQTEGGAPLPPGFAHVPGETLYLSFQVQGYQASADNKISLLSKTRVYDPKGVLVMEPIESKVAVELAPEDKNWKPKVSHQFVLPPIAPSGEYRITMEVTDELAKATATKQISLEVRGHAVEPSDTLTIRNFRFYRSEDEVQPLARPAYRPGDAVWARFDIIGYKYGAANAVDVSYGISVIAPSGKVLWGEPEAAVEKTESFYPKYYVPGTMGINLQPNIRPGEYSIVVTARDRIGNQTCESKQTFTIE